MNNALSYKEAMNELESIVKAIETESVDVDELTEKIKRAAYLSKHCSKKLKSTETEIKNIFTDMEKSSEIEQETGEDTDPGIEPF